MGHLLVALDAVEALALDRLVFIPAAKQPLKTGRGASAAEARLEMVRRTVDGFPSLGWDSVEVDRAGLSYSVETVADYASRFPDAALYFLLGADAARSLPMWREPERLASMARLVLLARATDGQDADVAAQLESATRLADLGRRPVVLATRRIDLSSTEIRDRVRRGLSIKGFVTDAVASYIAMSGLYRQD
ncbi:MAG: putative nicotinate-nucleotide adenylyltransferase [Gemmatimonadaceae bacterium]|nr:putative nicotinate-nucleotide adenylyltransferase [Gemmatimonadaceae bacterium]